MSFTKFKYPELPISNMADTMTIVLVITSVIFSSIIVWLIMSQRMARLIESTRSESEKKIAETIAREEERKDMANERNTAMSNSFKLIDVIETFCDQPLKLDIFFSKTIISCSTSENNSELKNRKLKVNNLPFDCIYNFLLFNT